MFTTNSPFDYVIGIALFIAYIIMRYWLYAVIAYVVFQGIWLLTAKGRTPQRTRLGIILLIIAFGATIITLAYSYQRWGGFF